jgi:1,4-alpha-glucan branching enzyme
MTTPTTDPTSLNTTDSAAAVTPGMGAVPYDGGVAFRVWAPNARAVAVVGDFNEWSPTAHPLTEEDGSDGNWYVAIPGVEAGAAYKYAITTADGELVHRIDPYARQVTNSVGQWRRSTTTAAYDWEGDEFHLRPSRAGHLRDARRLVQSGRRGRHRHPRVDARAKPGPPGQARRQCRAGHARGRVRG